MAAADRIVALIDDTAERLTFELNLLAQALEGLHVETYQLMPSMRGLQFFLQRSQSLPELAATRTSEALREFGAASLQLHTAGDGSVPEGDETARELPIEQMQKIVDQLRMTSARNFRAQVVSRSSMAPPRMHMRLLNRAGRAIQAPELFFLTARKAFLDQFNEDQLAGFAAAGATQVRIYHPNPEHEVHGKVISLVDGEGQTYTEAAEWFHPRSSAIIGAPY